MGFPLDEAITLVRSDQEKLLRMMLGESVSVSAAPIPPPKAVVPIEPVNFDPRQSNQQAPRKRPERPR